MWRQISQELLDHVLKDPLVLWSCSQARKCRQNAVIGTFQPAKVSFEIKHAGFGANCYLVSGSSGQWSPEDPGPSIPVASSGPQGATYPVDRFTILFHVPVTIIFIILLFYTGQSGLAAPGPPMTPQCGSSGTVWYLQGGSGSEPPRCEVCSVRIYPSKMSCSASQDMNHRTLACIELAFEWKVVQCPQAVNGCTVLGRQAEGRMTWGGERGAAAPPWSRAAHASAAAAAEVRAAAPPAAPRGAGIPAVVAAAAKVSPEAAAEAPTAPAKAAAAAPAPAAAHLELAGFLLGQRDLERGACKGDCSGPVLSADDATRYEHLHTMQGS